MGNNKYKLLIVENDPYEKILLSDIFDNDGFMTIIASGNELGKMMFKSYIPDLIILNMELPDGEGTKLLSYIRKFSNVPIIAVSDKIDENNAVKILNMGANDYIRKPFGYKELIARVRAILRLNIILNNEEYGQSENFKLGYLEIDYGKRQVLIKGNEIRMTQTEYNILTYLTTNKDKILTYSSIIKAVWGFPDSRSVKKLQVNITNIRKKLQTDDLKYEYIINEAGVGYRICSEKEIENEN